MYDVDNPFGLKKAEGDIYENFSVTDINHKIGLHLRIDYPNRKFSYWDLIDEYIKSITIECKNDSYGHHKSNNVCIEFGQRNKASGKSEESGILISESKFWLQCNGIEYDDAIIYVAYSDVIRKLYKDCSDFWKYFNILANRFVGDEYGEKLKSLFAYTENKIGSKAFNALYPMGKEGKIRFLSDYPVPQGPRQEDKPMDLFLVPRDIYRDYCLEVNNKYDITYKDLK